MIAISDTHATAAPMWSSTEPISRRNERARLWIRWQPGPPQAPAAGLPAAPRGDRPAAQQRDQTRCPGRRRLRRARELEQLGVEGIGRHVEQITNGMTEDTRDAIENRRGATAWGRADTG
mgnify:CR=1 FL=1